MLALATLPAAAQKPPATVPASDGVVLERLPRGYAALYPQTAAAEDGAAAELLPQVRALLAAAAATGDSRLAARADALLARLPQDAPVSVQIARAWAAQHRHDFTRALVLLDGVLARDPRNVDARAMRAQIQLVQGRLGRARDDCAALALGLDAGAGLLCATSLSLRRGDYAIAARAADRWPAANRSNDDDGRRHALLLRAEIAARAGADDADIRFRDALAAAPRDVRTLTAYARHLRASGRPAEALAALADAPDSEGVALQRALAAHSAIAPEAGSLKASLARRYALAATVGGESELRERAEFLLTLQDDADTALVLAQRNFETQRDFEDVDLLLRAAAAAKRTDALGPLHDWARSQGLSLPRDTAP